MLIKRDFKLITTDLNWGTIEFSRNTGGKKAFNPGL
jgi:hypothetical protein